MKTADRPAPVNCARQLQEAASSLLRAVAADEQPDWGGGEMTPAPYDTAWAAMVRSPRDPACLAFPESLDWLLEHQRGDGSWGEWFPHTLLPTMAGLLALRRAPRTTGPVLQAAERAEAYLRGQLGTWAIGKHESVGFEVVAPFLLDELDALGVPIEFPAKNELLSLYRQKTLIAAPELIYEGQSNLVHSLEAFVRVLDFRRLESQQVANGSYGCSPAATAAVLIYGPRWDEAAEGWLTRLSRRQFGGRPGGMPNAYPIDAFEAGWVLYNLAHGRLPLPEETKASLSKWLEGCVTPAGASISRVVGLPTDSDDTGVVLAALNLIGAEVDVRSLLGFEREAHFACFERERGASMSANAHVLAAFVSLRKDRREAFAPAISKLTRFLLEIRDHQGFWVDKWHVSPFYATASAILALSEQAAAATHDFLRATVAWVLAEQKADGGWGVGQESTMEETAYALQILQACGHFAEVPAGTLRRGFWHLWDAFARHRIAPSAVPQLWLGKELYAPVRVVLSTAIGALHRGVLAGSSVELAP
jgi:halimadienyl-diphosphate synthase